MKRIIDKKVKKENRLRGKKVKRFLSFFPFSLLTFLSIILFTYYPFSVVHSRTPEEQKLVNEFLDTAFNAYVDGDYEKAIVSFQKVLQIDPKDKTALRGLKQCRKRIEKSKSRRVDEEEKNLKMVKRLIRSEKWVDAVETLHGVLSRVSNHNPALELQNEMGLLFRQKMSLSPIGSSDHLIFQGMLFYLNKKYDEAVKVWKEALKLLPDDLKLILYIERGERLYRERVRYETVVLGRPRAQAAFSSGNYEEAAALWKKILEFEPKDEEANRELAKAEAMLRSKNRESLIGERYDKGLSLFLANNFKESLKEWKEILAIDPKNEVAKNYVKKIEESSLQGQSHSSTQVVPEAKRSGIREKRRGTQAALLKQKGRGASSLKVPSRLSKQRQGVGSLEKEKGGDKKKEAQQSAIEEEAAVKKDQNEETKKVELDPGIALYKDGHYANSLQFFENKLSESPENAQIIEWIVKVKKEQTEKAEERYRQGLVAYTQGKVSEAVKEWQASLKILPNYAASVRALNKVVK